MNAPLESEFCGDYIYVSYTPGFVISPESAEEVWQEVSKLCADYDCRRILIDASRPEQRLDTMTAFETGRQLAEGSSGLTIAMCFRDFDCDDPSLFFKTVAQNRGVNVEFFTNLDDAQRWLGVSIKSSVDLSKASVGIS